MKKGVSPIIGAVILILITMILGAIIYSFSVGLVPQPVLLSGSPVELRCSEVEIEAAVFESNLDIINRGNIPLMGIVLKKTVVGQTDTYEITIALGAGESVTIDLGQKGIPIDENVALVVSPILPGQTEQGTIVAYTCETEFVVA